MKPWRVVTTDEVVGRIRQMTSAVEGRTPVVAVDGRSNSGKTTFSDRVVAAWPGAAVVHTDDIAWWHAVLDWTDLLVEGVLEPVRAGRAVSYRPPQWEARGRSGAVEVPAGCTLLLVEGVGSGRRSLAPRLDGIVWVEALPADRDRRDRADVAAGLISADNFDSWMREEIPFVEAERTWERADLVVAGWAALPHDPGREFLVAG